MTTESSFAQLIARLRAGDDDAANQVFQRFAARLIGLAHLRLERSVRPKVEPEDVVQSVFKSFFQRHAGGQFDLADWDGLWSLLVVLTVRKCGRRNRQFLGPERDVRKEVRPSPAADSTPDWGGIDDEPTPEEAAMLTDTVAELMRGLDERERLIVEMRLQGYTVPEISQQVGRTEFTVAGKLKRIRKRLQDILECPEPPMPGTNDTP